MKKFLVLALAIFMLMLPTVKAEESNQEAISNNDTSSLPEKTDHAKVKIYIFRGEGCGHCYDALTYFNENIKDYEDYIEVITYEVYNSKNNSSLMTLIGEELGVSTKGVPLIIIGDNYSKSGFGSSTGEVLVKKALEEYQNDDYVDLVAQVIKDNNLSVNETNLREACIEEGIAVDEEEKADNSYDTLIVIGIFVVIIGGFAALIKFGRK